MLFEQQPRIVIETSLNRKQVIERLRKQLPTVSWFGLLPIGISASIGEREVHLTNRNSFTRSPPARLHLLYEQGDGGTRLVGRFGTRAPTAVGVAFLGLIYLVIAAQLVHEVRASDYLSGSLLFLLLAPMVIYVGWRIGRSLRRIHEQELLECVEQILATPDATVESGVFIPPVHLQPDRKDLHPTA